jgi:protein SCO1/2
MNAAGRRRGPTRITHAPAMTSMLIATILIAPAAAPAQRTEPLPEELEGVGIAERLEAQLPLDAAFRDEDGLEVTLGRYFEAGRPVILNPGYYTCPMLCGLVSNGLLEALQGLDWTPGQEFEIVTFSFDPGETPRLAKAKKESYLREYGRPSAAAGWHWLTGNEAEIRRLTDAIGFGYRWLENQQQYAHAAALIVCTPEGRVARYLYGIQFDPQTLRLSLVEAADGKVGSTLDRVLLFCFHYDAQAGRYGPAARNLMQAGGMLTVLILGGFLLRHWRRERRRRADG